MTPLPLPYEALLFDFDYTLADSSEGIILCTNHALDALGLPPAAPERIRATIGLSLGQMLARLGPSAYPARADEFFRLFMSCADEVMVAHTRVYPAVAELVQALAPWRPRLGILSTKFRYRIEAVLRRDGLLPAFELIIGGEDVRAFKPDPEGLLLALRRWECAPADLLYVGDSPADAEAAQRAGVPFVGVLSGVTPAEALAPYTPAAILPDVSRLPRWLSSLTPPPPPPPPPTSAGR